MNEKVIYFSLNEVRRKSFYEFVVERDICYSQKFSFSLETGKGKDNNGGDNLFKDPRDLIPIIENSKKKDSLHVIIDYVSCCNPGKIENYSTVIRDIIMAFPEVQFLFDETFVQNSDKEEGVKHLCFLNFLFKDANIKDGKVEIVGEDGKETLTVDVIANFHQFDMSKEEDIETQFIRLLKGRNNMFDGSNLRCAIRTYKLLRKIKVQDNFSKITESRRNHLAIVVEEEYQQSMFNGYCLYANGYRVIPVMTATELKWINKEENKGLVIAGDKENPTTIVIRDYDLQFIDEDKGKKLKDLIRINSHGQQFKVPNGDELLEENEVFEIDLIRGAKDCTELIDKKTGKRKYNDDFIIVPIDNNPYWSKLKDVPTFFVSKGGESLKVSLSSNKNPAMNLDRRKKKLLLYGIQKPIEGIYVSMQRFMPVKKRYSETTYGSLRKKKNNYRIVIKRKGNDGHSCPLDIYGIGRSMVNRAESYYRFGRPRLAALVANEALEILNGFHMSLMRQAYYIKSVSENAIAMNLLGGDEAILCDDLIFRIKKVRTEVNRIVLDKNDRENLLLNIYNDCRLFCREREYLDAADDALSYMMRDKEGWNLLSKILS